ncbi:MAG: carboxypeptidase regulatory-like domain-containing protein, partial [Acidobacteria bacterium]|nr:carboxypeptidase regulatory-like domain-containing protein [Acidobacteriota bacterium]
MSKRMWMVCSLAGILSLTLVLGTCGTASAQEITGDLRGIVHDSSGGVVAGATVTVVNTERNVTVRTLKTGADGSYIAPYLPVGKYEVVVQASGFNKYIGTGITLNVNDHRIV